jgi:hypothetical protein
MQFQAAAQVGGARLHHAQAEVLAPILDRALRIESLPIVGHQKNGLIRPSR